MSACSKVVPDLQSAHRAHRKILSYLSLLLWRDYIILFHLSSMVKYLLNPKITIRRYRFSFRLFIPQMVPRAEPPLVRFLPRLFQRPPGNSRFAGLLPDFEVIQRVEIAESPVKRVFRGVCPHPFLLLPRTPSSSLPSLPCADAQGWNSTLLDNAPKIPHEIYSC